MLASPSSRKSKIGRLVTNGHFATDPNKLRVMTGMQSAVEIMGILNVTPDSFFDGGKYTRIDSAVRQAERMVQEGADLIDVGGESSRPGSKAVGFEEEIKRVAPVVKALKKKFPRVPISIDTQKSEVACRSLEEGAEIVNDISAFRRDPRMAEVVRRYHARAVLMHMQGSPQTMQKNPKYKSVVEEVKKFLAGRIRWAAQNGIPKNKIWIDPGIGFGKTAQHNLELLSHLDSFLSLGVPLLVGASRKSFIGFVLAGNTGEMVPPEKRLEGSLAAACCAALKGASVLRVHDVGATKRALQVIAAVKEA